MGSAWTTPKTWTAGMVLGETDMNTYIRDNQNALKTPPFQQIITASANDLSITASTAVPIKTDDLEITLTTHGGAVQWYFQARFSAANTVLNMEADGTAFTNRPSGITRILNDFVTVGGWFTGLASGAHTFTPTITCPGGITTIVRWSAEPVVFWCREIS